MLTENLYVQAFQKTLNAKRAQLDISKRSICTFVRLLISIILFLYLFFNIHVYTLIFNHDNCNNSEFETVMLNLQSKRVKLLSSSSLISTKTRNILLYLKFVVDIHVD